MRACVRWSKIKGQHDEGQQDRESPRGKSSGPPKVSEFCDLVVITSVPLGGFGGPLGDPLGGRFSSQRLVPVAPHRVAP